MESKNTVLAHNRHDVRSDTYRYQIEQRNQVMKLDTVADSKCLHELETDTATRKVCVRIRIVQAFGIQDCDGRGEDIVWYMMVADDKVDSLFFRIRDFLYCFYSAIEYNNQSHTGFGGVVHTFG